MTMTTPPSTTLAKKKRIQLSYLKLLPQASNQTTFCCIGAEAELKRPVIGDNTPTPPPFSGRDEEKRARAEGKKIIIEIPKDIEPNGFRHRVYFGCCSTISIYCFCLIGGKFPPAMCVCVYRSWFLSGRGLWNAEKPF